MLVAFHIGSSLRNVLLVQAVQVISAALQVTPGGAGVQQALFVAVFSGIASGTAVAAYSVGQQIALSAFTLGLAFVAMAVIFRTRGFRQLIRDAKAARAAESGAGLVGKPDLEGGPPESLSSRRDDARGAGGTAASTSGR